MKPNVCSTDWFLSDGARRVRALARESAKARRLRLFERKDREYAAAGVRVAVRLANGVKVEMRGRCCCGSRAGIFDDLLADLNNRFRAL